MVKAALKNPYAVIVLALAILVIGLTAIWKLPTDILPTFKTPAVQVVTFYPGMPAEVMEKDITTRLERWTGQSIFSCSRILAPSFRAKEIPPRDARAGAIP